MSGNMNEGIKDDQHGMTVFYNANARMGLLSGTNRSHCSSGVVLGDGTEDAWEQCRGSTF
jgi:hypothetical protein